MASSSATLSSQPFRFLQLPAELRNRVYSFVFTAPESTVLIESCSYRPDRGLFTDARIKCLTIQEHVGMLTSCKEIWRETSGLYVSLNVLKCEDTEVLYYFLRVIGQERRRQVRQLSVVRVGAYAKQAFTYMKSMENLQNITFHLPDTTPQLGALLHVINGTRASAALYQLRGLRAVRVKYDVNSWPQIRMGTYKPGGPYFREEAEEFLRAVMRPRDRARRGGN